MMRAAVALLLLATAATVRAADPPLPAPIQLDDIHFTVTDEAATVRFLESRLDA